jgi:hypothetical protein
MPSTAERPKQRSVGYRNGGSRLHLLGHEAFPLYVEECSVVHTPSAKPIRACTSGAFAASAASANRTRTTPASAWRVRFRARTERAPR